MEGLESQCDWGVWCEISRDSESIKMLCWEKKKGKKKTSNSFGIQSQLDLEENEEPQDKINYIQGCNCSTLLDDKGWERTLEHREKPGYVQNIHLCVWYVPMCLCMCMCACLSVCEPACTERSEVNCRCFSLPLPPYFTSQSLCLNLESTHWGPGTHPSQTPQLPRAGIINTFHHACLIYVGSGELKLRSSCYGGKHFANKAVSSAPAT